MYNDGKVEYDLDDPEAQRPRQYAVKTRLNPRDLEPRDPVNYTVEDTVRDLVSRCIRGWMHREGLNGVAGLPEIVVKFADTVDPWGVEIIASIHEPGTIKSEDLK
jgi:hypothetical protein